MSENKKDENKKPDNKLIAFAISKHEDLPKFIEVTNKDYAIYGTDKNYYNQYPKFLIELKNASSLHGSILRSLAEQVAGASIKIENDKQNPKLQAYIDKCNPEDESLHDVIKKISIDFTTFGGWCSQVNWEDGGRMFDFYHMDFSTIRSGKMDNLGVVHQYYQAYDWSKRNNINFTTIPSFDSETRSSNQLYFYKPYSEGLCYYPLPSYVHLINWALCDFLISDFHVNNLECGWFPNLFINFPQGIPTDEEANKVFTQLMNFFSGTKGGKVALNWSNGKDTSPEVTQLNSNDSDKKWTQLSSLIDQKVLSGHRIVSSELVGIKSAGNLGDNNFVEASELFFNQVIKPKQKVIEDEINYMLSTIGFTDKIEIEPVQPVSFALPSDQMMKICTINEMRELINKEPIKGGDVIVEIGKISEIGKDAPPPTDKKGKTPPTDPNQEADPNQPENE